MQNDEDVLAQKIETWIGQLGHTTATRRLQAAANLCRVGAVEAVHGLVDCLRDENVHVRKMAALGLGEIAEPVEVVVPALVQALADHEPAVQRRVLVALTEVVAVHPGAVPLIQCGLSHPDAQVRHKVAEVLSLLEPPHAAAA